MTDRVRKRREAWRKINKPKQAESVVETITKAVNETVATKADLEVMASKLATKDDIKDMATKEELGALADKMATKDDIKDMATKSDLALLGADLEVQGAKIEALRETVEGIKENIAKNVATKADLKAQGIDIANLETRIMRMMWLQLMVMVSMFVTVVVTLL